jgi:excisionase family DNA binding protein
MNNYNDKPLNVDEAAEYLSIAKSYLYKLVCLKKVSCYKPGKLYFRKEDLDKYAFQNRRASDFDLAERADGILNR